MNRIQRFAFAGAAFGASIAAAGCSGDNPTQESLELRKCAPIARTDEAMALFSEMALQTFENPDEDISEYYARLRKDEFGSKATTIYTPLTCNRGPISRGNLIFDQNGEYQPVHVKVTGELVLSKIYGSDLTLKDEDCIVLSIAVEKPDEKMEDVEPAMIGGKAVVYAACAPDSL